MRFRTTILFWVGAALAFALFLYVFRGVLLPFVLGMGIAYFLDPIADRLQRLGLGRVASSLLIVGVFLVIFIGTLILIVPVLRDQVSAFLDNLPRYVEDLRGWLQRMAGSEIGQFLNLDQIGGLETAEAAADANGAGQAAAEGESIVAQGANWVGSLLSSVWSGGQVLFGILSATIVTPVVAFYLLVDWDRMVAKIDSWLPRDHAPTIRHLFKQMNHAVAGFVRGQLTICLIQGIFYAVGLSLVGLNFGLLIGLGSGLIGFIPLVGAFVGGTISVGVALFQFGSNWVPTVIVLGIFLLGQLIENNFLQPKLVGSRVGLHPVWLIFSLFAFGALFGFVGTLVAVPAAAAVGVLARFLVERYKASPFYKGREATHPLILPGSPPADDIRLP